VNPSRSTLDHAIALAHLQQSDPLLGELIQQVGDCNLGRQPTDDTLLSALVKSIIYQRISIKAANTVYARFLNLYAPAAFPSAMEILATPDPTLRSIGLPGMKVVYLKDLAQKVLTDLPDLATLHTMEDEAIIQTLTQIKGIGRWSVQMLLMFQLYRLNVLPVDDLGIRAAIRNLYRLDDLPTKAIVERLALPWQPYRTIACWYLWYSRDAVNQDLLKHWA
jgi:DNA-3-methyladenine glycosylase II